MFNSHRELKEYDLPKQCWLCQAEIKLEIFNDGPWGLAEEEGYFCSANKKHYKATLYKHMDESSEVCEEIQAHPYLILIRDNRTEVRSMFSEYFVPVLKIPQRIIVAEDYTLEEIALKAKKSGFEMRFWTPEEIKNFEMLK